MTQPVTPRPRKEPKTIEQLGRIRVDDYAWMKDDDWQQVLQARMFEEMKGRIKEDDASVPDPDGAFEYFSRYELGAQHPRHLRRARGAEGGEELLLDEAARGE